MEDEFRSLVCEKCQKDAPAPKLLSCLHTLCSECFDENDPRHCPVCGIGVRRFQDNLLFPHLRDNLTAYQKLVTGRDLACSRCKGTVEFWCSACNQFLCKGCYEAHQWYLKLNGHEARKIEDIKTDSAAEFLKGVRKSCTLFCPSPPCSNPSQVSSLYCRQCQKPLCCACALLHTEHAKFYCNINTEIQQRKEELGRMSEELREKNQCYEQAYLELHQKVEQVEQVRNETRDLIREKVDEMVQHIRQVGDQLVEEVDRQLLRGREEVQAKLQGLEQMVHRMKTSRLLVEKMTSFASDQIVMDMHPFIKESLEELKREKVPMPEVRDQTRNFDEVKKQLQTLFDNVTGQREITPTSSAAIATDVPPSSLSLNTEVVCNERNHLKAQGNSMPTYTLRIEKNHHGFTPCITSRRKRLWCQCEKHTQSSTKMPKQDAGGDRCEKSIQASPRVLKHEDHDGQEGETSTVQARDAAPSLPCTHETTPAKDQGSQINVTNLDSSPLEVIESEAASIVISSSEETDVDDAV